MWNQLMVIAWLSEWSRSYSRKKINVCTLNIQVTEVNWLGWTVCKIQYITYVSMLTVKQKYDSLLSGRYRADMLWTLTGNHRFSVGWWYFFVKPPLTAFCSNCISYISIVLRTSIKNSQFPFVTHIIAWKTAFIQSCKSDEISSYQKYDPARSSLWFFFCAFMVWYSYSTCKVFVFKSYKFP